MRIKTANLYRRIGVITLSLALLFCSGCGDTTVSTEPKTEGVTGVSPTEKDTENDNGRSKIYLEKEGDLDHEILLVIGYSNSAWGYSDHGIFITGCGNVYGFDFSQLYYPDGGIQGLEKMEFMARNLGRMGTIDPDLLEDLYEIGMKIDPDTKMDVKNEACDAGENYIAFRNPVTGDRLVCYEQGDSTGYRQDINAKRLANLWQREGERSITTEQEQPDHFLAAGNIPIHSFNCDYFTPKKDGEICYVTDNADTLRRYAKECGFDVETLLSENVFDPVYFIQMNNIPKQCGSFDAAGFLYGDGTYRFVDAETNHYEVDGQVPRSDMTCYAFVAAVSKHDLDTQELTDLKAPNGKMWVVLK